MWDRPQGGVACKADPEALVAEPRSGRGTVDMGWVGTAERRQVQVPAPPSNSYVPLGKRSDLSASLVNEVK